MSKQFPEKNSSNDLTLRYQLGKSISKSGAATALADRRFVAFANLPKPQIRELQRFAEVVNDKEFEHLQRLQPSYGHGLTWTKVRRLLAIPDRKERLKMARRAATEKWSLNRLFLELRIVLPVPTRGAGRRHTPPESPEVAVSLFDGAVTRTMRVISVCIDSKIRSASPEAKTRAKQRIKEARLALQALQKELSVAN